MEAVRRILFGFVLIMSAFRSIGQTPGAPPPAVLVEVEKIVETQTRGSAWKPATVGRELGANDGLRTGEYSRAVMRFNDFTTMRLDELTTIEISRAVAAGRAGAIGVKRGGFYFLRRGKPQELRIRSAYANGALKGTELIVRVSHLDKRMLLAVLEGEAELSNDAGSVTLNSGEIGEAVQGRKPTKTAVIDAVNIMQWCLYYPGVLDPAELGSGKSAALDAYRAGDLPKALAVQSMRDDRLLRTAAILSSGQVEKALVVLESVPRTDAGRLAIERMIAAVQFREWTGGEPRTASEWVAESYYRQSRGDLDPALQAALKAAELSPNFGFAWVRAAEMQFSFGRTIEAMKLLERGLELAPRNAQAHALRGFLLAAQNRTGAAREAFDEAIALDGALGNAWLGRGLVSIRQGRDEEGRLDLQTAAVLEPNRSVLRSYLGKAFSQIGGNDKANIEFARAKELDPNDPTPWLYSAIQRKQENRYNEAITELEKSIDLNPNRTILRSKFLLDQDRAIRGTNLAAIFENNGMTEQSVREAVRAVDANYASAPAHLFLANSYEALRDATGVLTRYEAATFNELLLSHLLSPVGGGPLSQFVSQQEYSKLFEQDGLGFATDSQYFSDGRLSLTASQYGTVGNISYALDGFYVYQRGTRPNNGFSSAGGFATFKLQLGPQDTVFFQSEAADIESGDVTQRYNPKEVKREIATLTTDVSEKQDPGLLLLGWHREWNPQNHTLLLAGRLAARQHVTADDTEQIILQSEVSGLGQDDFIRRVGREIPRDAALYRRLQSLTRRGTLFSRDTDVFDLDQSLSFEVYGAELQHILTLETDTVILGGRYQRGEFEPSALLTDVGNGMNPDIALFDVPPAHQNESVNFERVNLYAYNIWHVTPRLSLTGGLVYDNLHYPENFRSAPVSGRQVSIDRVSPKAGFILEPWKGAAVRGAYTEGVSGASFDESFRLEPTQVAGFLQSYRSLISESLIGAVAGSKFKTFGLSLEQKLPSRTYLGLEFNALEQDLERTIGVFERLAFQRERFAIVPSQLEERDEYREETLTATINQLLGDCWSVGGNYRYTHSVFVQEFEGFDAATRRRTNPNFLRGLVGNSDLKMDSGLHHLNLFALYNHPSGFFARAEANWFNQSNDAHTTEPVFSDRDANGFVTARAKTRSDGLPSEDFWHFNVVAGWRFHRNRGEISCGLLNLTGQDYRLLPLNPYEELARDRTVVVRCRLSF